MEVAMSEQAKSEPKNLSRRQTLSMLGLAATVGYIVPTVLTVSDAEAGAVVVRRTRRRRSHPDWWYRRRRRRSHPDWWYRRSRRRRSRY
jgi:hypothetical protein